MRKVRSIETDSLSYSILYRFPLVLTDIECDDPGQRRQQTMGYEVRAIVQRRCLHLEIHQRHLRKEKSTLSMNQVYFQEMICLKHN